VRQLGAAVLVALAVTLTACGGDRGGSTPSAAAPDTAWMADHRPPAEGCGSFDAPDPADPDGALASLDRRHRAAYAGLTNYEGNLTEIHRSAWGDWTPGHPPPYRIGASWSSLFNDYQRQIYESLKDRFEQAGHETDFRTTGDALDVPQQLRQFDQVLAAGPDLIILQAATPDAFGRGIDRAAAAGIPVITVNSTVPSPNAVNVDANYYLGAAEVASQIVRALDGRGNVVFVHGIAGTALDSQSVAAWKAVAERCPQIDVAGEVYGGYTDSIAKQEMLKYLGTHPQKVDAVLEAGGMGVGTRQAFEQAGRPVPIIAEGGPTKGQLGYHNQHPDSSYFSAPIAPAVMAGAVADTAKMLLDGHGLKLNVLVDRGAVVNDANLSSWDDPAWTPQTPGSASGPRDWFLGTDYLRGFAAKSR
jgi:ribose transport system substrate-binding protein